MPRSVEVAIIGAGSAGLSAAKEVRKCTGNFAIIERGPRGTTCARVGCMPSKVLVETAEALHRCASFGGKGIEGTSELRAHLPRVLQHVRQMRDRYVDNVLRGLEAFREQLITGTARFGDDATTLRIGDQVLQAKRVIIATGSSPYVPAAWHPFRDKLLTSDSIFEEPDVTGHMAVVGLGAVGVELAQALARLGVRITAFDPGSQVAGLTDAAVSDALARILADDFELNLQSDVTLERAGNQVRITSRGRDLRLDKVLVAAGRRPNMAELNLHALGVPLNEHGVPEVSMSTMRVPGTPVYVAGDANGRRPLLHEASDDGRIAGFNATRPLEEEVGFCRRARLSIVFCQPNAAAVGLSPNRLEDGEFVEGEADFRHQSRAGMSGRNAGLLRIYAARRNGRILGAQMAAPAGEHLAHLLAWAVQQQLTVFQMLRLPYYHPVIEEGVRGALRQAGRRCREQPDQSELAMCDSAPDDALE